MRLQKFVFNGLDETSKFNLKFFYSTPPPLQPHWSLLWHAYMASTTSHLAPLAATVQSHLHPLHHASHLLDHTEWPDRSPHTSGSDRTPVHCLAASIEAHLHPIASSESIHVLDGQVHCLRVFRLAWPPSLASPSNGRPPRRTSAAQKTKQFAVVAWHQGGRLLRVERCVVVLLRGTHLGQSLPAR